jgi:hypothetical protein
MLAHGGVETLHGTCMPNHDRGRDSKGSGTSYIQERPGGIRVAEDEEIRGR